MEIKEGSENLSMNIKGDENPPAPGLQDGNESGKKDVDFLDEMRELSKKGKTYSSNELLPFLIQVEDLVQQKDSISR